MVDWAAKTTNLSRKLSKKQLVGLFTFRRGPLLHRTLVSSPQRWRETHSRATLTLSADCCRTKCVRIVCETFGVIDDRCWTHVSVYKQRFLTPGHQGWNDLHSLCRIGMEYYLLNNDDHNIIYWIMMIIMIMMMTMMIIGTATIMIMIIIITTTLTMTIMKMIMIKTAQTPCQSLYKDRRI